MGLRTEDAQTKMHEDTLKLIALGKNKIVQDLKMILDKIKPIENTWKSQISIYRYKIYSLDLKIWKRTYRFRRFI